jgi:hypothetical protein
VRAASKGPAAGSLCTDRSRGRGRVWDLGTSDFDAGRDEAQDQVTKGMAIAMAMHRDLHVGMDGDD